MNRSAKGAATSVAVLLLALALGVLAAGCGDAGDAARAAADARNPFLGDGHVAELQVDEELGIDLTGDGIAERVHLTVHGPDPRALEIELSVLREADGAVLYESAWSSADYPEIQRAGGPDAPAWVAGQAVRERLEELFGDDAIRTLAADEIDPAALRRELRIEEWRAARGMAGPTPITVDDDALAAIQVPDARVAELAAALAGRPAFNYAAGDAFRTIVWSPELGRFLPVYTCC